MSACEKGHDGVVAVLLEKGASIDLALPNGFNSLQIACENGSFGAVKSLIESGASVNEVDGDGESPLYTAALHGHLDVVRFLLENNASASLANISGWTPLMKATEQGHVRVVKALLKSNATEKCIDLQLPTGATALNIACEHGQMDIVVALVNRGASIELADYEGYTPLITAAQLGYSDIVQFLVNRGVNMNARLPSGGTALVTAIWYKRLDVVRILLDNGANINLAGDFQNWPPLTVAYFSGYSEIVQLIYEILPPDKKLSFFDIVSSFSSFRCSSDISEKSKVNVEIDHKRRNGDTALRIACERGEVKTVETLLNNPNNDINLTDKDEWTPLMSAC
ncbi:hypothetical protein PI124_g16026 [Phytophthora idaei]|nr:hypothetical protein PI124_g16026 [Phytophthora idaei]